MLKLRLPPHLWEMLKDLSTRSIHSPAAIACNILETYYQNHYSKLKGKPTNDDKMPLL